MVAMVGGGSGGSVMGASPGRARSRGVALLLGALQRGADLELFRPLPARNTVTAELGLDGRFVVMYSGLLGIKHGLEVVLEAAHR